MSYDANGNLLHLKRNGVTDSAGNNHMDAFTYHYESNTNQLSSVEDLNDNNDPNRFNDLKNQYQSGQDNYIYNDIGQLVSNLQDNIYYEYSASGLVDRITTIGASNSGDLATLYFEDYTNATAEDVMGWTDNNTDASGAGAFSGFSINHGTYKVGGEKCVYLSETYENSLNVVLPNGVTAMRSFDVHADVQHILDLDIIVSQSAVLFAGEVPPQYHIGYHIRVKDANGTILATETINNPPQIIHNDLPGGDPMLLTTCDYFYDNRHHLSFTPTSTTVQLEIEMITPDAPTALLNIDNVHLQASAVPKLAFYYNDRGHRVKKQAYTGAGGYTTTYYIRDAGGNPMAIYEAYQPDGRGMYQPPTPKEYPVYGNSRLGVYFKDTSSKSGGHYVYQLADHLGNVRAVVMKSGNNSLSLTNKTDYYPFGMPMPNRNIEGNYRYGYQGEFAEKEPELGNGQNSFELRLWDSRIGRWLKPDPLKQFHSPYLGMYNNPILSIDKTGGLAGVFDPPYNFISPFDAAGNRGVPYIEAINALNNNEMKNIPNTIRIYAHGGPNGISYYNPETGEKEDIHTAEAFDLLMTRLGSPDWRRYKEKGGELRIELLACNTASDGASCGNGNWSKNYPGKNFAQRLSESFSGVEVVGASGFQSVEYSGSLNLKLVKFYFGVRESIILPSGGINEKPGWRTYKDGLEIDFNPNDDGYHVEFQKEGY